MFCADDFINLQESPAVFIPLDSELAQAILVESQKLTDLLPPSRSADQTGLDKDEERIINHLVIAWNNFVHLGDMRPDDLTDFRRSIHECERIIMARIVRRAFPGFYGGNTTR